HRTLGDAWGVAYSVYLLGFAAAEGGEYETAREHFAESLRRFSELGDDHYTMLATDGLAWMSGQLGDLACRRELHEDNLRRARASSNKRVIALTLDHLAGDSLDEGRVEDALTMLKESLGILHAFGDRAAIAQNL